MTEPGPLTERQSLIIRDHLALVFDKRTPDRSITKIHIGDMSTEAAKETIISMRETFEENPLFVDKSMVRHLTC